MWTRKRKQDKRSARADHEEVMRTPDYQRRGVFGAERDVGARAPLRRPRVAATRSRGCLLLRLEVVHDRGVPLREVLVGVLGVRGVVVVLLRPVGVFVVAPVCEGVDV